MTARSIWAKSPTPCWQHAIDNRAVKRPAYWRRTMLLGAFGAQLAFILLLALLAPHFAGGCPESTATQQQADQYDQLVTVVDLGLLTAVVVTLFLWSAGRKNRYVWIGVTVLPAVVLAGLSLAVAGLQTMSLCNMIQT
jgi:hypothetical protein